MINHRGVSVDYQNISDDRQSSYYTKLSFQMLNSHKKIKIATETFSVEVSLIKSVRRRKRGLRRWDEIWCSGLIFSLHPWSKELIKRKISLTRVDSRGVAHLQSVWHFHFVASACTGLGIMCTFFGKNLPEEISLKNYLSWYTSTQIIFIALHVPLPHKLFAWDNISVFYLHILVSQEWKTQHLY